MNGGGYELFAGIFHSDGAVVVEDEVEPFHFFQALKVVAESTSRQRNDGVVSQGEAQAVFRHQTEHLFDTVHGIFGPLRQLFVRMPGLIKGINVGEAGFDRLLEFVVHHCGEHFIGADSGDRRVDACPGGASGGGDDSQRRLGGPGKGALEYVSILT